MSPLSDVPSGPASTPDPQSELPVGDSPLTTGLGVDPRVDEPVAREHVAGQPDAPGEQVAVEPVAVGDSPLTTGLGVDPSDDEPVPLEPVAASSAASATAVPPTVSYTPPTQALEALIGGAHHDPHGILGAHAVGGQLVVRTLRPNAKTVTVVAGEERAEAQHIHGGVWQAVLDGGHGRDYRLEVSYGDADHRVIHTVDDPYRYLPTLGEVDLHLVGEGRHERLWDVLGSHVRRYDTPSGQVIGTSFAVWAPNARGVRVSGDFNFWDGSAYPMRSLGSSGVWELFIPGVVAGSTYKYQILGADSTWREKADPMARQTEIPPATASVVTEAHHAWNDDAWIERRAATQWHAAPMSIYEVHLGSWRVGLSYRELATELVSYVRDHGFTHVEFLPVAEHPFGGSWGYQVTSYFAPTSRFGSPDDFRFLVDALHQAGIGVLLDWVPAHFPKDAWALGRFDGTPLYEHPDPRRGEQLDWGTYVFDFGRREVRNFLVANALYWCDEFHIDGLRVDAVASMLYLDYSRPDGQWAPNEFGGRENLEAVAFLQEANATVYREFPGVVMIAEESTAWPGVTRPTDTGGLGFGFKWNMGWMHDSLEYISKEPIYRSYHHHQMTFSMVYAYSENYVLPISHDEVVHGKGSLLRKMPGDRWQQLANLRALLAYMWAHPGKQLLFMGCEFGQESEWSESRSLDWWLLDNPDHAGVSRLVRDLNGVYRDTPALWTRDVDPAGFAWIDASDSGANVFSFVRSGPDDSLLACVANFSGGPHENYRIGLPRAGRWSELINTDADAYAGSGVGNLGAVHTEPTPYHGLPQSVTLRLPPLGTLWLRWDG